MRRWIAMTLTLLALCALTGCGGLGGSGGAGKTGEPGGEEIWAEDGFAEARAGDLVHSYFMDFTVNSAYTASEYHGHVPPEGRKVLVVEITIKNTNIETIPMYDDDFQGQWSASPETDEFAWPITEGADGSDLDVVSEEQLPARYDLAVDETRTGVLVFDVPADERDFSISHRELFGDNSEGDTFFVYFTAEER
nr:hypothetical protein [uncultured Oscillibacter sp.]